VYLALHGPADGCAAANIEMRIHETEQPGAELSGGNGQHQRRGLSISGRGRILQVTVPSLASGTNVTIDEAPSPRERPTQTAIPESPD